MIGRCQRCGKADVRLVWAMWRGRLVQVGGECVRRIAEEKLRDAVGRSSTGSAKIEG